MAFFREARLSQMRLFGAICLVGAVLVGASFGLSSCIDDDGFPDILAVNIEPSTVSQNQMTGSPNETIDVEIVVANFEGAIEDADVFIQLPGGDRDAVKDDFVPQGDAIVLVGVNFTWFSGLETGDYQVGARVVSDAGETVQELDLATVRIVE